MNSLLRVMLCLCMAMIMSGCSVNEAFQQLTRTKEEQAADTTVKNAQALEALRLKLDEKKKNYTLAAPLRSLTGEGGAILYAYSRLNPSDTVYDIEGRVPKARYEYEAWVTNDAQNTFVNLGKLKTTNFEDYYLSSKLDQAGTDLTSIVVSDQATPSAKPSNPVYASKLITVPTTSK